MAASNEQTIFAGGYLWGMQDLLHRNPGVISTRVGYTCGDVPNATAHAEAIEMLFDPGRSVTGGSWSFSSRFMIRPH